MDSSREYMQETRIAAEGTQMIAEMRTIQSRMLSYALGPICALSAAICVSLPDT
jgi:hypothetical protein